MTDPQPNPPPDKSIWFPAKRYGWGWGFPITWQGWLVLVLWIVITAAGDAFFITRTYRAFDGFLTAMCCILLVIAFVKGEPPRWRWGK
jgi:hypothetical protein